MTVMTGDCNNDDGSEDNSRKTITVNITYTDDYIIILLVIADIVFMMVKYFCYCHSHQQWPLHALLQYKKTSFIILIFSPSSLKLNF